MNQASSVLSQGPASGSAMRKAGGRLMVMAAITAWALPLRGEGPRERLPFAPEAALNFPAQLPFSFRYGGEPSADLLRRWPRAEAEQSLGDGRLSLTTTWTDPETKLRVYWERIDYSDFPAAEWLLRFENTGSADTPIIQDIQALDAVLAPRPSSSPFRLHRTKGSSNTPTDFEASAADLTAGRAEILGAAGGRSSNGTPNGDLPFFKIEAGEMSLIVAIGWTGQWRAALQLNDAKGLHVVAGMQKTHFRLHSGEKVRSPRILVLCRTGDTWESNAAFRQLIFKHYCATRDGARPLPTPFCNSCFTRGGGWLNQCNAANQISLIRAYGKIGLEAFVTDAGWFEGGWPKGAGNWTPRKDAYPDGMGPVAAAAKESGMIYGLWFEPERAMAGTAIFRQHPDWLLPSAVLEDSGIRHALLANFGLREVQDYFFNIVAGFMALPGFRFYRQDFNMDPLTHWQYHDAPDRQGITEIKYMEGLYAYWDRIRATWPDALLEDCASGGRRIDLETVMRLHLHQKTDYWFHDEADQAQIWGLSQYLPNNVFVSHLNRMDEYSFRSSLASSLCLGWIADDPAFDAEQGRKDLARYREVRPLLIGAWYPLLPCSRDPADWMASQYHRPDLDEGMILCFRHSDSPYPSVDVALRGLIPGATYELKSDRTGAKALRTGAELMSTFTLTLPAPRSSDLITYRRVATPTPPGRGSAASGR